MFKLSGAGSELESLIWLSSAIVAARSFMWCWSLDEDAWVDGPRKCRPWGFCLGITQPAVVYMSRSTSYLKCEDGLIYGILYKKRETERDSTIKKKNNHLISMIGPSRGSNAGPLANMLGL